MQTEKSIIAEFQLGSEKGLNRVFRLYNRPLLYFALQFVKKQEIAEEVVADVFIKIWQRRNDFEDVNKIKTFLYISVKNGCLNYLKSSYAQREMYPIDEWQNLQCQDSGVLQKIVKTELIKSIYDELYSLPEKQREVFLLSFIEDLEVEDISKRLGMSVSAVYANKSRALASLRKNLKLSDSTYLWLLFYLFH